ncbi:MAG TPA: DNA polymerase III subunit beta [Limnochordales bacterium]
MNVICPREQLAAALAMAERAAAVGENLPVLGGVRLQAAPDYLELAATDLEISVAARVAARVEQPGSRVVDARLFSALVRRLEGLEVELRAGSEASTVEVRAEGSRFSLVAMPADDFPELPRLEDGWRVQVPARQLEQAVAQSRFACAASDQRPVLSGVLVEVEGSQLRLVATDSSRLAYREVEGIEASPFGNPGLFAPRVIVPARALDEVRRICAGLDADAVVTLALGERLALLEAPSATLATRLIEGHFPPYRQVFLDGLPSRVRFRRQSLLDAVQRVALLSRRGPAVVQIQVEDGQVLLRSAVPDAGEGEERVEAVAEGPGFTVAYQARFLEDVLKAFGAEEVELELGDPARQGTFRIAGDPGYRYIVMPWRTG